MYITVFYILKDSRFIIFEDMKESFTCLEGKLNMKQFGQIPSHLLSQVFIMFNAFPKRQDK